MPQTIVCAADFGHLPSIDDTPPFLGPELGTVWRSPLSGGVLSTLRGGLRSRVMLAGLRWLTFRKPIPN